MKAFWPCTARRARLRQRAWTVIDRLTEGVVRACCVRVGWRHLPVERARPGRARPDAWRLPMKWHAPMSCTVSAARKSAPASPAGRSGGRTGPAAEVSDHGQRSPLDLDYIKALIIESRKGPGRGRQARTHHQRDPAQPVRRRSPGRGLPEASIMAARTQIEKDPAYTRHGPPADAPSAARSWARTSRKSRCPCATANTSLASSRRGVDAELLDEADALRPASPGCRPQVRTRRAVRPSCGWPWAWP